MFPFVEWFRPHIPTRVGTLPKYFTDSKKEKKREDYRYRISG